MIFRVESTSDALPTGPRGPGDLLQLLRDGRERTRSDLVDATGQSRTTIRFKLDQLIDAGLVVDAGEAPSTGGRPATRFAFDSNALVVLGIDIGLTHARIAVTDLAGELITDQLMLLDVARGPEPALAEVLGAAQELLASTGRANDLAGVGIGVPAAVDKQTGRVIEASAVPAWAGYDVRGRVARAFKSSILVDNDVNLMARGEHAMLTPPPDHMLFLKIASSVGAGVIVSGQVVRGARGAAGNFGHIRVAGSNEPCACQRTGCIDAVASGRALVRDLAAQGKNVAASIDVVRLVEAGDEEAITAIGRAGEQIGEAIVTCVNLLNPSVVVIGGVLALAGAPLLDPIRRVVLDDENATGAADLQVTTALAEQRAGVLGAAAMIIDHVLAPAQVDTALSTVQYP